MSRSSLRTARFFMDIAGMALGPEFHQPSEAEAPASSAAAAVSLKTAMLTATSPNAAPSVVYAFQIQLGASAMLGFDASPVRVMEELRSFKGLVTFSG